MSAAKAKRRPKPPEQEEHVNHERWLVTYGDMLTLLMVLFIVLFAISQVDQKKYNALRNGLATGFGAPPVGFAGDATTIDGSTNEDSPMDLSSGTGGKADKTSQDQSQDPKAKEEAKKKETATAVAKADLARQQKMQEHAQTEVESYDEIKQKMVAELQKVGTVDRVQFTIDERGLIVTVITSAVVFAGDRADLLPGGAKILQAVGPVIAPLPNRIEVDGHTNQLNVATVNYPSGWELSTARACTVVRYLHTQSGIAENRLSAVGYADTKPLYAPSDRRAVEFNRRGEIVVQSQLPAAERALLPSAAGSTRTGGTHE
jgi:chemotaxis protein MotB